VLEWWQFDVDWVNEQNTTIAQQPNIDVSEFDSDVCGLYQFSCFPQPGTSTTLDPLREVIMFRLQYRNSDRFGEVLAGNMVVDVDGTDHGGLRWFELRPDGGVWQLYQEGTFAPDDDHRWMAASATDQSGNFAIGYNVTSSTTYPSLRYSGRLWDDPLGLLTQGDLSIHAGTASNSSNRYGDYAAMSVDPADDCTFWFTGMDNTQSFWRTQIASFRFETCGCDREPAQLVVTAEAILDNEIELSWNDADLETVTEYQVKRSRTQKGTYELIATVPDTSPGIAGGPDTFYTDTDVSGGTTYYYVVRAFDGGSCLSDQSSEVSATATGECTLQPIFNGLESITAPFLDTCELQLAWLPAVDECGGPLSYNVYRSTVPGFTPGAGNLLAPGLTTSAFVDFDQLVHGTDYFYVVRAVDAGNGEEDDNLVQLFDRPRGLGGPCTTVSACSDNPYVDVQPDGPLSGCAVSGFTLNAMTTGGNGSFAYQWTRDGVDIPGATESSYRPTDLDPHTYNVRVQSDRCVGFATDPLDTAIDLVDAPFFDGVTQVVNPQTTQCALQVEWNPGTTVCPGPVRYFVYRSTTSPVAPTQENLIAAGVSGTSLNDTADLISDTTYNYLVRAQDASTGQFDSNLVEAAATPDGPGSGIQTLLSEDFEVASAFADWSVTTGPGVHTCGEWARSNDATKRPSDGSGFYALADNGCGTIFGRTSTTLTSPAVDPGIPGLVSATLDFDLRFDYESNTNTESGKVEVFDGSSWIIVWQDSGTDFNGHLNIDVTPWATGNSSFQVRFDYQDATQDKFISVDNVVLTTLAEVQCSTAPAGPATVPDGTGPTSPLLGSRTTPVGDVIDVSWDAGTCPASSYNLLYGDLADVDQMTVSGSECSLGTSGSFTWNAVPAGDLFFLVVGTDGASTEGGWGLDDFGGERNGLNASGECGMSLKDASQSCP
jgi:hypothetical protein